MKKEKDERFYQLKKVLKVASMAKLLTTNSERENALVDEVVDFTIDELQEYVSRKNTAL